MRACLAATESEVLSAFPTAFAPGILDPASTLSFSRWESSCFLAVSSVPQATAPAASKASINRSYRDDKEPPNHVGVLLVS
jgi:hypothetical protein